MTTIEDWPLKQNASMGSFSRLQQKDPDGDRENTIFTSRQDNDFPVTLQKSLRQHNFLSETGTLVH